MSHEINSSKIVKITKKDGTASWQNLLSTLLNKKSTDQGKITNATPLTDLDAKVPLLMESDIPTITVDNKFEFPINSFFKDFTTKGTKSAVDKIKFGLGLLDAITNTDDTSTGTSFYPWMMGIPAWESTSSNQIEINYTFKFKLGQYGKWNAYEEVVKPIVNLMAMTLPQYIGDMTIQGPFPNAANLLVGTIKDAFNKMKNGEWYKDLSEALLTKYREFTYDIAFGDMMTFYNMIAKKSVVNLSKEVDELGNPISGSITMTFKGIIPLTVTSNNSDLMAARFGRN